MAERVFGKNGRNSRTGWKTWIWFIPSMFIGGGWFLLGTPIPYSGLMKYPALNPHFGYISEVIANPMVILLE
jgi:hypothetical protein